MIWLKTKKCEKVVNDLVQKYHSDYEQNLRFKISGVDQKFTLKGLPISTIVVNDKLNIMYDYIDKLFDYVFQSMKVDFPELPLKACKKFLINAVEDEYKKLPDAAKIWLMQACLAQPHAVEQYRKTILERLEQTKENIESRC
jgi:hypothetical protein